MIASRALIALISRSITSVPFEQAFCSFHVTARSRIVHCNMSQLPLQLEGTDCNKFCVIAHTVFYFWMVYWTKFIYVQGLMMTIFDSPRQLFQNRYVQNGDDKVFNPMKTVPVIWILRLLLHNCRKILFSIRNSITYVSWMNVHIYFFFSNSHGIKLSWQLHLHRSSHLYLNSFTRLCSKCNYHESAPQPQNTASQGLLAVVVLMSGAHAFGSRVTCVKPAIFLLKSGSIESMYLWNWARATFM